jgi:hypothetical protein
VLRRPPKMNALMCTPFGSSHAGSMIGFCPAGAVKRAFGCDEGRPASGVQSFPCQSVSFAGGASVIPSHQMSPSGVSATFVKMVLALMLSIAFGLVLNDVPGATPK